MYGEEEEKEEGEERGREEVCTRGNEGRGGRKTIKEWSEFIECEERRGKERAGEGGDRRGGREAGRERRVMSPLAGSQ